MIRTALNEGILYDLGAADDFSPAEFTEANIVPKLSRHKRGVRSFLLAQTICSHPHVDHIREIERLVEEGSRFHAALHTSPHDKHTEGCPDERLNWQRITNPDGSDDKLDAYKSAYAPRTLPLQTIQYTSPDTVPNLEYGIYYVRPPAGEEIHPSDDQAYSNAVSLVLYLRQGKTSLLVPGDITPEAMERILFEGEGVEKRYTVFSKVATDAHPEWHTQTSDQPGLRELLRARGLSVLVAPHHGLESGFCTELFTSIMNGRPDLVVISERRHRSPDEGEVDARYQSAEWVGGLRADIEGEKCRRYSVTTRTDHHILIELPHDRGYPSVHAREDPDDLLQIALR